MGKYVASLEDPNGPVWQRIAADRYIGASWFIHEMSETRNMLERGVDVFGDEDARQRAYKSAHSQALLVEHDYLWRLARRMQYNLRQKGSLIRFNPTVVDEEQRERDFEWAARQEFGLDYDDRDKTEVLRFYKAIE
jgi:hypothetical protein